MYRVKSTHRQLIGSVPNSSIEKQEVIVKLTVTIILALAAASLTSVAVADQSYRDYRYSISAYSGEEGGNETFAQLECSEGPDANGSITAIGLISIRGNIDGHEFSENTWSNELVMCPKDSNVIRNHTNQSVSIELNEYAVNVKCTNQTTSQGVSHNLSRIPGQKNPRKYSVHSKSHSNNDGKFCTATVTYAGSWLATFNGAVIVDGYNNTTKYDD